MWRALHSGWSKYQKPWLPLMVFFLKADQWFWFLIQFQPQYFIFCRPPAASCNSTGEFLAMLFPPMESLKMPPERKATRSWIRPCNRGSIGIHRSRCPITWLRWSSEQRQFCGEMVTTKLGISLDVKKITEDHLQIRWFHLMSDSGTIVICQIYGARAAVLKQSRLIYPAI